MKIECPHCGGHYDVEPQYIGQTLKCIDCENEFEVNNPNLIPCPDCFAPISRRASCCPHCGAVLKAPEMAKIRQENQTCTADFASEKEVMLCRPSAMNYLWAIILGIVTCLIIIGIFILLYVWIEMHYTTYRITTLRIIVRRGWIGKLQNEIWIKDMRAVNLVQGIWQRFLGVGNILIGSAATAGTEISMIGISNPQKVVDTINSLRH